MTIKAIAILHGDNPTIAVSGVVIFTQENEHAPTHIDINIKGLKPGEHGFHIHEFGDNSNGCISAGGHYNPFNKQHGAPGDENRHAGDLGNVTASTSGTVKTHITDKKITLFGPYSVVGRSVIVHADVDDLGKGGHKDSRTTGNAGARLACGVIGMLQSKL